MEEITSELKISELKQGILATAYEELHSQASSMLVFSLQWRDLASHFESIRKSLQTELEAMAEREKEVVNREKQSEVRESELDSNLDSKRKELEGIEELIGEQRKVVDLNLRYLDSLKSLIQDNQEELEAKERQYVAIQKLIADKERELDSVTSSFKEGEEKLEFLGKRIKEKSQEYESRGIELERIKKLIGEQVKELESKMQLVDSVKSLIEENREELKVKEKQYVEIQKSVTEKEKELDSIRNSTKESEEKLELLEKRTKEKSEEYESRVIELDGIEKLIGEQVREIESKMQLVDSLKSLIEENREELEAKEKQYVEIQKLITQKERELDSIRSSTKEGKEKLEKLESLEKMIKQKSKEAETKAKELDLVQKTLRGYKDDIELKERKYNAIRRSLVERRKEIESKEEKLRKHKSSMDDYDKEIKVKEEYLDSLQNSIAECSNKLELKQKQLDLVEKELELKEQKFVSLKKSVEECARQFKMKASKIEDYIKKLELKEKFCESKCEELDVIHKKVNEGLKECVLKQKEVNWLQKLVEKRSSKLAAKESEFKKMVNEFELRQKEIGSSQKSAELRVEEKPNIVPSQVKVGQLEYGPANNVASCQQSSTKKGKDLQILLNQHLKRHDSVCAEIFSVVQASSDPGMLVLDAMEGFYPLQSSGQNSEFDVNIVRRSCILLLEQLMESSAPINPQVREEAMKLAGDWKAKMTKENYLEALGFLQLLTSYNLASAFDSDELRNISIIVSQLVTPKIEQTKNSLANVVTSSSNFQLDTVQNDILALLQTSPDPAKLVLDHIQGCFSQHWRRGDTVFDENAMRSYIFLFEKLLRTSPKILPLVKEDARKLAVEWEAKMRAKSENHWEVLGFLQFLASYKLVHLFVEDEILKFLEAISQHQEALESCLNLGFAGRIPEFVRNLIQKKKLTDAVRIICAFKLTDKFPPLPLLTKYMDDLKEYTKTNCKGKKPIEEKDKITDEEIAALTAVLKCIEDCKLDSKNFEINISKRLKLLEQMKRDRRRSALIRSSREQEQKQQQQPWKKRKDNNIAQQGQPQQGTNKFPRTSSSSVRPGGLSIFIPVVRQAQDFPPHFVLGESGNVSLDASAFPNGGCQDLLL